MTPRTCETDIVAGERIGDIGVADSLDQVVQKLSEYQLSWEHLPLHRVLHAGPYRVWFDNATGQVTQVLVGSEYAGRFLSTIGVGSTLRELEQVAGAYYEKDDAYRLHQHPGICFELEDVEDWDEELAPIEFITVFPPEP